jgi:hypothetical protein
LVLEGLLELSIASIDVMLMAATNAFVQMEKVDVFGDLVIANLYRRSKKVKLIGSRRVVHKPRVEAYGPGAAYR